MQLISTREILTNDGKKQVLSKLLLIKKGDISPTGTYVTVIELKQEKNKAAMIGI